MSLGLHGNPREPRASGGWAGAGEAQSNGENCLCPVNRSVTKGSVNTLVTQSQVNISRITISYISHAY